MNATDQKNLITHLWQHQMESYISSGSKDHWQYRKINGSFLKHSRNRSYARNYNNNNSKTGVPGVIDDNRNKGFGLTDITNLLY